MGSGLGESPAKNSTSAEVETGRGLYPRLSLLLPADLELFFRDFSLVGAIVGRYISLLSRVQSMHFQTVALGSAEQQWFVASREASIPFETICQLPQDHSSCFVEFPARYEIPPFVGLGTSPQEPGLEAVFNFLHMTSSWYLFSW